MEDTSSIETSIINLPDDCLSFIFHRLNNITDRYSFGLTSRRWLNIQNINRKSLQFQCSFSILNPSTLSQTNPEITSNHLQRLLTRFQYLEHLSLSGCTVLNDSSLNSLQYLDERLLSLHLDYCFKVSDIGITAITTFCPNLRVVSLYRCNITDIALETLAKPNSPLKRLNLSCCPFVSDVGIKALSKSCLQLESVKMFNCQSIIGIGFNGCSSTLTYIDAEACQLEPKGIKGIISGGGIEFLNISGCDIRRDGLVSIGYGMGLQLRILNMRMCRTVGDESIIAIAKGCPLLQEWNLALCHEIRVLGWEAVGKWCCNLEILHVNRCRNLCERGLLALQNGCEKMKIVYMSGNVRSRSIDVEIFRLYRGEVSLRNEEVMIIGPDWNL